MHLTGRDLSAWMGRTPRTGKARSLPKLIVYHAHPGPEHSHANRAMAGVARGVAGITVVDLYAEYPRFDIDIDREQARILDHDVILFQYAMFWYSTPSIVKEWLDLVLDRGFAYGTGGDRLRGKTLMLAVTAAGPEDADALAELARLHDPEIPPHLNAAYVATVREVSERQEAEMKGAGRAFASRVDPAWAPPTPGDVDAEAAKAREEV